MVRERGPSYYFLSFIRPWVEFTVTHTHTHTHCANYSSYSTRFDFRSICCSEYAYSYSTDILIARAVSASAVMLFRRQQLSSVTVNSKRKSLTVREVVDPFVRFLTLPRIVVVVLVCTVLVHRSLSFRATHRSWTHAPTTFIGRDCPEPPYETVSSSSFPQQLNICLTTLTDEKFKSWQTRYFGWRNFDGLMELTWDNKQKYATKHGYRLFDESDQLDQTRPASWSKIRAVQRLLKEESCDWVFWLDADTVVMNSDKKVEQFLPAGDTIDVLLSMDDGGGYNAGVWLVRNSEWTHKFLREWWDMKSFVKPPGLAKSGDNDALKYKTAHMDEAELEHVGAPARCTFNSFAKFVKPVEYQSVQTRVKDHSWYMDESIYHKGDFIAHVAGVDNKVETIQLLLEEAI